MMRQFARVLLMRPGLEFLGIEHVHGGRTRWNLPGGKVEAGEAPLDAALRETWEEVGIKCNNVKARKLSTTEISFGGKRWTGHFYVAFGSYSEPIIREPNKIKTIRWLTFEEAGMLPCHPAVFTDVIQRALGTYEKRADVDSELECLLPLTKSARPASDKNQTLPLFSNAK